MVGKRSERVVTQDSLGAERERIVEIAPEQSAALAVGSRIWQFVNAEGFDGEIVIWPDGVRAAIVSAAASHWGRWTESARAITLDNGDIYNEAGGLGEDA
jgi:hypothetical protein